jgi:hypothetical protein
MAESLIALLDAALEEAQRRAKVGVTVRRNLKRDKAQRNVLERDKARTRQRQRERAGARRPQAPRRGDVELWTGPGPEPLPDA